MYKVIFSLTLIYFVFLMSACLSPSGDYIVYKKVSRGSNNHLNQMLINKYGDGKYSLSFTDKYVRISRIDYNASVVLAKVDKVTNYDRYETSDVEGDDSVHVEYTLRMDSKDVILNVTAQGGRRKVYLGECSVDFYLAK